MPTLEELALKHALKNASEHEGRAQAGAVIGRVIAELPEAKADMATTGKTVAKVVANVNKMGAELQAAEMARFEYPEKVEVKKKLELPGCEMGKVVTRFPPGPNGWPHIGHAKAAWLGRQFADDWNGKCLLVMDETNPLVDEAQYDEAIKRDLAWLGLKFDAQLYISDRMAEIYSRGEQLLRQGDAYVCTCPRETIKANRLSGTECACRRRSKDENLELWKKMLAGGFEKGDVFVRFRGDMKCENTVMRDPALFRVIKKPHYRHGTKYVMWPDYDMSIVVNDYANHITHALRSKEYELRDELYYALFDKLGLPRTHMYGFSRLNLQGVKMGKRFIRPLVETGKLWGWDDPRLPTIAALRRRGIRPEAIKTFVLSFGLSKVESSPTWENLFAENRKVLDPVAKRYFFVPQPVGLTVKGAPAKTAVLALHPEKPEAGSRKIATGGQFYIAAEDAKKLRKGALIRLKDLYNVRITKGGKALEGEFAGDEVLREHILQWVTPESLRVKLWMPGELYKGEQFNEDSMGCVEGLAEQGVEDLKEGNVVQFVRVGFARLDSKSKLEFILAHR